MNITDFEILDHGIDNPDYFPGCGVSFTPFSACYTGIGDSAAEALNDALDSMAQCSWEWTSEQEEEMFADMSEEVDKFFLDLDYQTDCWHYVSIRVR